MSDYDFIENAVGMVASATVVNKFTEVVWVAVDRLAWDRFQRELNKEEKDETTD